MEYFNLFQIVLLIFVVITNIFIIILANDEYDLKAKDLCMWSIYMVICFAIYNYLGKI